MNKKIGNRVRKLIYAKGFSSIRKFADYLERVEPENYVTEDTIFNVIKGKNMRNDTLKVIADGLGVSMDCLISDDVPIAEDYQANSIRLANKKNLNDQEKKMKLELEQFENSESFEAGEKHYLEVTESKRAKYRTEMLERRKRLKVNNG